MDLKNKKSKRLLRYAICIKRISLKNGIGGLIKINGGIIYGKNKEYMV